MGIDGTKGRHLKDICDGALGGIAPRGKDGQVASNDSSTLVYAPAMKNNESKKKNNQWGKVVSACDVQVRVSVCVRVCACVCVRVCVCVCPAARPSLSHPPLPPGPLPALS